MWLFYLLWYLLFLNHYFFLKYFHFILKDIDKIFVQKIFYSFYSINSIDSNTIVIIADILDVFMMIHQKLIENELKWIEINRIKNKMKTFLIHRKL